MSSRSIISRLRTAASSWAEAGRALASLGRWSSGCVPGMAATPGSVHTSLALPQHPPIVPPCQLGCKDGQQKTSPATSAAQAVSIRRKAASASALKLAPPLTSARLSWRTPGGGGGAASPPVGLKSDLRMLSEMGWK